MLNRWQNHMISKLLTLCASYLVSCLFFKEEWGSSYLACNTVQGNKKLPFSACFICIIQSLFDKNNLQLFWALCHHLYYITVTFCNFWSKFYHCYVWYYAKKQNTQVTKCSKYDFIFATGTSSHLLLYHQ